MLPGTDPGKNFGKFGPKAICAGSFLLLAVTLLASPPAIGGLRNTANDPAQPDSVRLAVMAQLAQHYFQVRMLDSSLFFSRMQYDAATKSGKARFIAQALRGIGYYYQGVNDLNQAHGYLLRSLEVAHTSKDKRTIMASLSGLGNIQLYRSRLDSAELLLTQGLTLAEELGELDPAANMVNSLADLARYRGDLQTAIAYFNRAGQLAEKVGNARGQALVALNLGLLYRDKGEMKRSIAYYLSSLGHARSAADTPSIAAVYLRLGDVYQMIGDTGSALSYYGQADVFFQKINDQAGKAAALEKLGLVLWEQKRPREAIHAFTQTRAICEAIGDPAGVATVNNHIGELYLELGEAKQAEQLFLKSEQLARDADRVDILAKALTNLGRIRQNQQKHTEALSLLEQAMGYARLSGTLSLVRDAAALLSSSYEALGRNRESLEMFKQYTRLNDSLMSIENQRAAIRLEYDFVYEKKAIADSLGYASKEAMKNLEIQRQRIGLAGAGFGVALLAILAFVSYRGRKRADDLLLNILPAETARELKQKGSAMAREYEQATILFTDFVRFTEIAAQLDARTLVSEIDFCFQAFDEIVTSYGLEKIKTIGDAYMAAGGLPDPLTASPRDVVHAALEMQQFIARRHASRLAKGLPAFQMRVGIHTGPVVAGIVGVKKFQYDVWGDTVNIAARMESHGSPGQVNISSATWFLLQDNPDFEFFPRGAIEVKGKGMTEMYFVQPALA